MRKGINFPFSFRPGDRVIDNYGRICVVETAGDKNLFMVFDPYMGKIITDYKFRYKPYKQCLIKCIINFLKN